MHTSPYQHGCSGKRENAGPWQRVPARFADLPYGPPTPAVRSRQAPQPLRVRDAPSSSPPHSETPHRLCARCTCAAKHARMKETYALQNDACDAEVKIMRRPSGKRSYARKCHAKDAACRKRCVRENAACGAEETIRLRRAAVRRRKMPASHAHGDAQKRAARNAKDNVSAACAGGVLKE